MKRFYKNANYQPDRYGFIITLDGKIIKTPGQTPLLATTEKMAARIRDEWQAQGEHIDSTTMPVTRFLNTMIDRVSGRREAVIDELAAFGPTDLVCYRADNPAELVEAESTHWDPPLSWLFDTYGIKLQTVMGVCPLKQDEKALFTLRQLIAGHSDARLTGLHTATTVSGSVVLGLAYIAGAFSKDDLWAASMVDEDFQISKWGEDIEAAKRRESLKSELADLEIWLSLL